MTEEKSSQKEDDSLSPSDDAATSISTGMNETIDSESILFNRMPLLNYFRIGGPTIPVDNPEVRINGNGNQQNAICRCAAMAQVMLGTSAPPPNPEGVSSHGNSDGDHHSLLNSDLWKHPYHVIAFGLSDGSIKLQSAYSGALLIHEERFTVGGVQSDGGSPVVDISFDSTGTVLVAIDLDKNVSMWELKYYVSFQQHETKDSQGLSEEDEAYRHTNSTILPAVCVNSVAVSRNKYPNSWAKPTCIAVDPANRRNREKSFITGFRDGRLVLTRRGGLFQRRNDTIVYHAMPDASVDGTAYQGIECITWRGAFVAWADANGIKLLDVQSLTRIAAIGRPSGARPGLYPSLPLLRPTLVFERSHSLLISWGDCLMAVEIEDSTEHVSGNKRRSVECSMAWELDCVSCGISPLDSEHVIVLGVVPLEGSVARLEGIQGGNDIEVQILSRADGAVIYCDSLPVRLSANVEAAFDTTDSATLLRLLSSFALPKMEDSIEVEEQKRLISTGMDMSILFGHSIGENTNHRFQDAHLQWTLKPENDEEDSITYFDEETGSVDSDDYGFILRPEADSMKNKPKNETAVGAPPVIAIVTPSGTIRILTSTIDDSISHALSRNMNALALKHALRHKHEIRRHNTNDLVDKFLRSILRLRPEGESDPVGVVNQRPLSFRRMQIALKSLPSLLGERAVRWEKWIQELDAIPGVIFLLRESLPVRDPVLPPSVYESVLMKMFGEIEELLRDNRDSLKGPVLHYEEAVSHFLDSLLAWGPISGLQEYIRLYSSGHQKRGTGKHRECQPLEIALRRRFVQSCKSYLSFPSSTRSEKNEPATGSQPEGVGNALYSIANVSTRIADRVLCDKIPQEDTLDRRINSVVSLQAMARIRMMQQSYDEALRYYLMIGLYHGRMSFKDIELIAIGTAKETQKVNSLDGEGIFSQYEYILDLIEYHHLHRCLLDGEYLSDKSVPLFALIQLVGLAHVGGFLMKHCVAPELTSLEVDFASSTGVGKYMVQKATLPMDLVARQLERSPPLLLWYLNLVFRQKPELYVRFPNNYIPPKAVTELHRKHLDLHIKFAGSNKFSDRALMGVEKYEVKNFSTPLLSFLKATLPVGGLSAVEVRRLLDAYRSAEASSSEESLEENKSSCFALELAFVIEHSSEQTETEAKGILDLYLDGAKSLNLAVSYAQRQKDHSVLLWDKLISYCLQEVSQTREGEGVLFGSLLEVSAVYGADLSRLVSRIPAGMVIEGLRPRLVSAVADYRLKLGVHEAALAVSEEEKISLQRQVAHQSKRGVRYKPVKSSDGSHGDSGDFLLNECRSKRVEMTKTKIRRDRYHLSYSIPM